MLAIQCKRRAICLKLKAILGFLGAKGASYHKAASEKVNVSPCQAQGRLKRKFNAKKANQNWCTGFS